MMPTTGSNTRDRARPFTVSILFTSATFVLLSVLIPHACDAHEFWIEADPPRVRAGEPLNIRMFVGERFAGEELGYDPRHAALFRVTGPDGAEALVGEPWSSPTSVTRLDADGLHLIEYTSTPVAIALSPELFNAYLLEDGLYRPLAERSERGEIEEPGNERYTRFCKTFVVAGSRPQDDPGATIRWNEPVGHRLEIVPEGDPATVPGTDGTLSVCVLYEGMPLPGAAVFATPRSAPAEVHRAMTDRDGRARLPLDHPGGWMVSLVHMVRLAGDPEADWESSWATLVFDAGSRDNAARAELRRP